jgi:hypothetical protein
LKILSHFKGNPGNPYKLWDYFFAAVKFGISLSWDIIRVLLGVAGFIAFLRRVGVFYVVLGAPLFAIVAMQNAE